MRPRARRRPLAPLALAVLILSAAAALAADGIRATVDRNEATVEDQIVLTLTIEGSRSARPELPELVDFEVLSRGQSTQMSFVNGRMSAAVSYTYVLVPRRPGTFTIGPATVELDGQRYASEPIKLRILQASEQPRAARDLFLSTKVSTTTPYLGQQVVYIWRFYRRVRIGDARLEPQDFRGFLVEDLGEVREYEATVNGVQYLVSEIRKALFPQETGSLVIPPSKLTCEVVVRSRRGRTSIFDDFFGGATTETKILRSAELELEVRPLPPPPPEFTGLVGDFDLEAEISKAELRVGESATLRLTVRGRGNVQMIAEPRLPQMPDFKIYDDKPAASLDRSGRELSGSRTYSKALVPLAAGELAVPPLGLTFFDPDDGGYRSVRTAAIPLRVLPSAGAEELHLTESLAPTTGKVAVRILADDLLPIYEQLDAVDGAWGARLDGGWGLGASLGAPPLAFLFTWLVHRRRERYSRDAALRRRQRALRRARRGLREVSATGDLRRSSRLASRCLRQYIGDKLGLEGSALTPAEVDRELRRRGVSEELVTTTHRLLEELEAAQFGLVESEGRALVDQLEPVLRQLERRLR